MILRLSLIAVFLAACLATPAAAQTVAQHTCDASYAALSATDKGRVDYKAFIADCEQTRGGWEAPSTGAVDPGLAHVTGICADGGYTTDIARASACAHDGGVSAWFVGEHSPLPQPDAPGCVGAACETPRDAPRQQPPPVRHVPPAVKPVAPAPVVSPTTPVS